MTTEIGAEAPEAAASPEIDAALAELRSSAETWRNTPLDAKAELLSEVKARFGKIAEEWLVRLARPRG